MNNRIPRNGMTLVELTVAIALAAMLMASLVGVTQGVAKHAENAQKLDQPVWPEQLRRLIRRDVMAANEIWMDDGLIWMLSDPPSYDRNSTGLRRIGYGVTDTSSGRSTLMRVDGQHSETLAVGPTKISLERLDRDGAPQPLPSTPGPVPNQLRLWVFEQDEKSPLVLDLVVR